MKSTKLWIADPEVSYATAFQEYLNLKQSHLFQANACTDKEQLKKIFQNREEGILLLYAGWREKGMRIPKKFCVILLSDGGVVRDTPRYPVLYKYQSIQTLIKEVMYYYSDRETDGSYITQTRKSNKVIGVFSPVGGSGKTLFSLTLGQILAQHQNVLYLNLEECSGFHEFFGDAKCHWNLSDLVYFLRQNKTQFFYRLNSIVQKLGRMDYVPPCESYMDFRQITTDEWQKMLHLIRMQSMYDYVILDMGIVSGHEIDLLRLCDGIYMPVRKDCFARAKIGQWTAHIQILDGVDVESKLQKLELPAIADLPTSEEELIELAQSKLGMYIRDLLEEQE